MMKRSSTSKEAAGSYGDGFSSRMIKKWSSSSGQITAKVSSSVTSVFYKMVGRSYKTNQMIEGVTDSRQISQKVMEAENGSRALARFFKADNQTDSPEAEPEKSSGNDRISSVIRKAAAGKKSKLLQRLSTKRRAKKAKMDPNGLELCKRRILMGVKCRPINASGKLSYGDDGIILPEDPDLH